MEEEHRTNLSWTERTVLRLLTAELRLAAQSLRPNVQTSSCLPRLQLLASIELCVRGRGTQSVSLHIARDSFKHIRSILCHGSFAMVIPVVDLLDLVITVFPMTGAITMEEQGVLFDRPFRLLRAQDMMLMEADGDGDEVLPQAGEERLEMYGALAAVAARFDRNALGLNRMRKLARAAARIYRAWSLDSNINGAEVDLLLEVNDVRKLRVYVLCFSAEARRQQRRANRHFGNRGQMRPLARQFRLPVGDEHVPFAALIYLVALRRSGLLDCFMDMLYIPEFADRAFHFFVALPANFGDCFVREIILRMFHKDRQPAWGLLIAAARFFAPDLFPWAESRILESGVFFEKIGKLICEVRSRRALAEKTVKEAVDIGPFVSAPLVIGSSSTSVPLAFSHVHQTAVAQKPLSNGCRALATLFAEHADVLELQKFLQALVGGNCVEVKTENDYMRAFVAVGLGNVLRKSVLANTEQLFDVVLTAVDFDSTETTLRTMVKDLVKSSVKDGISLFLAKKLLQSCCRLISQSPYDLRPPVMFWLAHCCSPEDEQFKSLRKRALDSEVLAWSDVDVLHVENYLVPCFVSMAKKVDAGSEEPLMYLRMIHFLAEKFPSSLIVKRALTDVPSAIIRSGSFSTLSVAVEMVLEVSSGFQDEKLIVAESGILNDIAHLIYDGENSLKATALRIMRNVSDGCDVAKEAVIQCGVFDFAIKQIFRLRDNDSADTVYVDSMWIIAQMASGNDEHRDRVVSSDVIPLLIQCLQCENCIVKGCALRGLRDIAAGSEKDKDLLIREGVIEAMRDVIYGESTDRDILNAVILVMKLSEGNAEHKTEIVKSGIIDALENFVEGCTSAYALECVCNTIRNVTLAENIPTFMHQELRKQYGRLLAICMR